MSVKFDALPPSDEPILSVSALQTLRHCLGVNSSRPRNSWGYRNGYVSNGPDPDCEQLVEAGLMRPPTITPTGHFAGQRHCYHATRAGMEIAGLTLKRIKELAETGNE